MFDIVCEYVIKFKKINNNDPCKVNNNNCTTCKCRPCTFTEKKNNSICYEYKPDRNAIHYKVALRLNADICCLCCTHFRTCNEKCFMCINKSKNRSKEE